MATKKKMLQAAAGNAGGDTLDITDVFSTYLYDGFSGTKTIVNGIDLLGEGGLTWTKRRDSATYKDHILTSSGNGRLKSNTTGADVGSSWAASGFRSDGFNVVSAFGDHVTGNGSGKFVTWTFRKAPKFFDVVTWTGTANQTITHSLGVEPGMIIVKRTGASEDWWVYHRSATNDLKLNSTAAQLSFSVISSVSSTSFNVNLNTTSGSDGYVAYLFAHNNNDGEFGPDGDQDIIKCGGIATGGVNSDRQVVLGWEPQWILMKNAESASQWFIADTMRGWFRKGYDETDQANVLIPNLSNAESSGTNFVEPTAYGFRVISDNLGSSQDWVYVAIRAGSLNLPENVSEVYKQTVEGSAAGTVLPTGFPVDFLLQCLPTLGSQTQLNHSVSTRITGFNNYDSSLATNSTTDEASIEVAEGLDSNTGYKVANEYDTTNYVKLHHAFKRAKGCLDVAPYKGDDEYPLYHNLGAVPEMIWVKSRDTQKNWLVYHKDLGNAGHMEIDNQAAANTSSSVWDTTSPTDQKFYVGSYISQQNDTYLALLFASLDGISKVGSVSHSGTTTVDCGFSAGTAYLILKRTDGSDDWRAFRGIHSGNDYYMRLNSNGAEVTGEDLVDPTTSGFQLTSSLPSGNYIYYAIAKE